MICDAVCALQGALHQVSVPPAIPPDTCVHAPHALQAGVAECKWAIEYEPAAADAFQLNNPTSKVFANNCNVLLRVSADSWSDLAARQA